MLTRASLFWLIPVLTVGFCAWSWIDHGLLYQLTRPQLDATARVECLVNYFRAWGSLAPLAYLVFVTIEVVVAPIPGLMLYAPGGLLFGPVLGGGLALAGNVLGAGIACQLARSIRDAWFRRWFEAEAIQRVQQSLHDRGAWFIFLLRLNPLTSSDLVSYAAGLTQISTWHVMLATAAGMAPLCFAQAWLSDSLFHAFPQLVYPLLVCCALYVVVVLIVLYRMLKPAKV